MKSRISRHATVVTTAVLGLALGACGGQLEGSWAGQRGGSANPGAEETGREGGGTAGGEGLAPEDPQESDSDCDEASAPAVFKNALCLCGDYDAAGNLGVSSVDGEPGVFAINGHFAQLGNAEVQGTLIAHQGISSANLRVTGSMRSSAAVNVVNLDVGGDLYVGTDLIGVGMVVGGEVWVGGQSLMVFNTKPVQALQGELEPPCPCGDDALDVAQLVATARDDNDNASAGLPASPALFADANLVLNSGRYYFVGGAAATGNLKLLANGAVKIYVDGDVASIGNESIEITEGTTVDLYVAGDVSSVGNVVVGDRYHPAAFRLYVGGSERVAIRHVGNQRFRGAIYAPRADLELLGNVEIEGALFANTIADAGNLRLTFAQPTHGPDGRKCVPPPSTLPGPADDPDFGDGQPGGSGGVPGPDDPDFSDDQPGGAGGDPPPNKDGLPDPADLPLVK